MSAHEHDRLEGQRRSVNAVWSELTDAAPLRSCDLADRTGYCRATVRSALRTLEDLGLVQRAPCIEDGDPRSIRYHLTGEAERHLEREADR